MECSVALQKQQRNHQRKFIIFCSIALIRLQTLRLEKKGYGSRPPRKKRKSASIGVKNLEGQQTLLNKDKILKKASAHFLPRNFVLRSLKSLSPRQLIYEQCSLIRNVRMLKKSARISTFYQFGFYKIIHKFYTNFAESRQPLRYFF